MFVVLLCGCPLLLVNFQRFPFEVQESFYFTSVLKSSRRLELVVCMRRLLKLVLYAVANRKIIF